MDRTQKEAAVAELTEGLKGAAAIFVVDYRGISVTDAAELRGKLREADAVFKVVKNRLAKRAAADAGTDEIDELLVGPSAITLIHGDAVIAAKAIFDFAKDHDELEYKGGIMDGAALDVEGFQVIARLPGVDILRGQLVGVAASPITGLVRGLGSMVSGLAIALGQIAEQGLVTGEPPAEQAPAEEEPAAEAEEAPAEDAEPAAEEPAAEEEDAPAEEPEEAPAEDAEPAAEEPPAEEPAAEQTSEAEQASDENDDNQDEQAESSEEPEPEGEDSEDSDSETTTEEE
jgi:large subunit ribosomal protein L10